MATILRSLPESMPKRAPQVCLFMIVKNEAHVIQRCLESVKSMVHSWCIVDTGSTDGTQRLAQEAMLGIPGALYERPWVDFATNRTESLMLAQAFKPDYFLTIDADEVAGGDLQLLGRPMAGNVAVSINEANPLPRTVLLRADKKWTYKGRVHELPTLDGVGVDGALILGLRYETKNDGGRHLVPGWADSDLLLMAEDLKSDPSDQRKIHLFARMLEARGFKAEAEGLFPHCERYGASIGFRRTA